MTEKITTAGQWLFKQAPIVILLIGTNIAQYSYFTNQLSLRDARIERLQDKILELKEK